MHSPLQICGEAMLAIHQCLLSQQCKLNEIKTVYSHSQSFGQCQNWLNKHLRMLCWCMFPATPKRRRGRRKPDSAPLPVARRGAVRPEPCVKNIEAIPEHHAFPGIGKQQVAPSGNDKTSLYCQPRIAPVQCMTAGTAVQARREHDQIRVASGRSGLWEYVFYMDIEGIRMTPKCRRTDGLKQVAAFVKIWFIPGCRVGG